VRTAFIEELIGLAARDPRIWLVTGDLGFSVLEPFADRFPDRYINTGVAEQNMLGLGAGLAHSGATVFVYSIANFPTFRCLEQVRNDVCYPQANVTIVSVGSGFSYGSHGSTHHAIEDLAVMRALPGIVVVSPGDPTEARLATRALADRGGPAYLRLGKAGERIVEALAGDEFELGRMRCIREGSDVTLIATGSVLAEADAAANALASEGIQARVYSAHTVKPIDTDTLHTALSETAGVVTVEEHRLVGGLRSAVAEALLEAPGMPGRAIKSLGVIPDMKLGTGDQAYLRAASGIAAGDIADAARAVIGLRGLGGV
jgi:transketolase